MAKTKEGVGVSVVGTYRGRIERVLSLFGGMSTPTEIPDRSNVGRLLGEFYLWKTVSAYAEKKMAEAMTALTDAKLYSREELLKAGKGDHVVQLSKAFVLTATVTDPVMRMSTEALQEVMKKSKYKIPLSESRVWLESAKQPSAPMVRNHISEREQANGNPST